MIDTIANLLGEFVKVQNEVNKQQGITHPVTIGAMYEGLTEDVLQKAIFRGLNLVIAKTSFIEGLDTEMDIILASGDGEKIPYTDRYKFKKEQVIAVVQVKKNLYSNELKNAYENLQNVANLYVGEQGTKNTCCLATDAIRNTLKKDFTAYKKRLFSLTEEYVYHALVTESNLPLRIVIGYNGFSSEYNFREGFIKYLDQKTSTTDNRIFGYGPTSFPSLIVCRNYTMAKMNGIPYCAPLLKDNNDYWWPFLTTSNKSPMLVLLEMLWTKLTYMYNLSDDIFGEDLTIDNRALYLLGKVHQINNETIGWDYKYVPLTQEQLTSQNNNVPWEPIELDSAQSVFLNVLSKNGEIDINSDKNLESYVITNGYASLSDFMDKMLATGFITIEESKAHLITRNLEMVLKNGRTYAADNVSGRLTRWAMKNVEQ